MMEKDIKTKIIAIFTIASTVGLVVSSVMFGMYYQNHSKFLEKELNKKIVKIEALEKRINNLKKSRRMYIAQLKDYEYLLKIKGRKNVK